MILYYVYFDYFVTLGKSRYAGYLGYWGSFPKSFKLRNILKTSHVILSNFFFKYKIPIINSSKVYVCAMYIWRSCISIISIFPSYLEHFICNSSTFLYSRHEKSRKPANLVCGHLYLKMWINFGRLVEKSTMCVEK